MKFYLEIFFSSIQKEYTAIQPYLALQPRYVPKNLEINRAAMYWICYFGTNPYKFSSAPIFILQINIVFSL